MTHRFKRICHDRKELLEGVETLSQFMRRLEAQAQVQDVEDAESYKGDGFEAFVEVLIKASPIDKRINIIEYKPITSEDMGVDGAGVCHDGVTPHTVQVKYRSNVQQDLTANRDHLSNFVAHSLANALKYEGPNGERPHMSIFTTAKGLHYKIDNKMYVGRVHTWGYNEIKKLVDKNVAFWERFRREMGTYI